jgi:hypothetical protein
MTEHTPPATTPRVPSTMALAILITITLLAIAALGWLWLTRYAPVHFDVASGDNVTITDARTAAFIGPLLGLGVFLIALLWLGTWIRARWDITPLPIIIGMVGVLALVFAGRAFWQNMDDSQPIRIVAYDCDSGATRPGEGPDGIPDGCALAPEPGDATLGTLDDPAMEEPDDDDTTASAFTDLPRGTYEAVLTATGTPDTATVILAAETDDGLRPVSRLEHRSGDSWRGTIALHPNLETYALLRYDSPYPAAPEATLRFTVQHCTGTSAADFDSTACEPAPMTTQIIDILPPDDPTDAGRPPTVAIEDDTLVLTNLEERTYTLSPAMSLVGNGLLVIPSEDTQTADRNILQQTGAPLGTFEVEITGETRDRAYTVYVIEEGVTFARVRP